MKFVVNIHDLNEMVKSIFPAVETRSSILPAFKCIKLLTADNRLLISAVNSHMCVETTKEAQTIIPGEVVVSGLIFSKFLETIPAGNIEIFIDGEVLRMKAGRRSATLNTMNAEVIPPGWLQKYNTVPYIELDIVDALKTVSFAASDDSARDVLNYILVKNNFVAATCGHRLAMKMLPASVGEQCYKIHRELVDKFRRKINGKILIGMCENKMLVINDETRYVFPGTQKDFPNIEAVIPKKTSEFLTLNRNSLLSVIKNIKVLDKFAEHVKTIIEVKNGVCSVYCYGAGFAEIKEEIECQSSSDFKMGIKAEYMLDALELLKEETVTLNFQTTTSPVIISEGDLLQVVMPLRL